MKMKKVKNLIQVKLYQRLKLKTCYEVSQYFVITKTNCYRHEKKVVFNL